MAIVDMSIDVAFKKALVVLRVPLGIFDGRREALSLNDVSCVGLEVSKQWNGEMVSEALQRILGEGGSLKVILKDNGSDLVKGVDLWRERHAKDHVFVVSDQGHELILSKLLPPGFSSLPMRAWHHPSYVARAAF